MASELMEINIFFNFLQIPCHMKPLVCSSQNGPSHNNFNHSYFVSELFGNVPISSRSSNTGVEETILCCFYGYCRRWIVQIKVLLNLKHPAILNQDLELI